MKVFRMAAVFVAFAGLAVAAGPALAQAPEQDSTPHINMLADTPSKTPEEKAADDERDKAYKESLRKIPDAKSSSDPWGVVRTGDAPKAASTKAATAKAAPKPKIKTGSNAN